MKDGHIHMIYRRDGRLDPPREFRRKAASIGIDGGAIFSLPPVSSKDHTDIPPLPWEERLDKVLEYAAELPGFYPVLWFDPMELDARRQVRTAAEKGIRGFKVICTHFYPQDAMTIWQEIADAGKPLQFHSGILWTSYPAARFNRPLNFEFLVGIKGLRFALAHIGWPWCEEYISLYGSFAYQKSVGANDTEFFVDLAPGTPACRRREYLEMLYQVGYDVAHNTIWSSDSVVNDYDIKWAQEWQRRDREILDALQAQHEYPLVNVAPGDNLFQLATETNFERFFAPITVK